jgi:hypothetical protein
VTGEARIDPGVLKAALAPSPSCATIEELGRFREGAAGEDAARVAEHVAGCLRCRTELALLEEFIEAAPRPDEEADVRWIAAQLERDLAPGSTPVLEPSRSRRRWRAPGARGLAGAALALAAALLLVVLHEQGTRPPVLSPDAADGPEVFRSGSVASLTPAGDLDRSPTELRWEPFPGAASYSIVLMEVDRTPVWEAEAREPGASLPPEVRARMVPGKPLLWQVVARDAAGAAIATSSVQRFRVRLPQPQATP